MSLIKEEYEEDPYAVSSSDDEDAILSDEDIDLLPGVCLDAPVISKQIVQCSTKDCEGDALKRHARDKIKWTKGAFCFKCRIKQPPVPPIIIIKEYPTANQDWQEVEFQEYLKEYKQTEETEQKSELEQKRALEEFNLATFELFSVKKTCRSHSRSNSV